MKDWQSMAHVKWECKSPILFIRKYRKKKLYGKVRKRIGEIFQELCRHKRIEILEGHAMPDRMHMCLSLPPKFNISVVRAERLAAKRAADGAAVQEIPAAREHWNRSTGWK